MKKIMFSGLVLFSSLVFAGGVGGGGGVRPEALKNFDAVKLLTQNRSEFTFLVAHPDDSVEQVSLRPEEFAADKAAYLDAVNKSAISQSWEVVK